MSIYATLWQLKFPRYGDDHTGCDWVDVIAQGVPGHIGTPTPGHGYEDGDPYDQFLPPPIAIGPDDELRPLRAVVFVIAGTRKGTKRSPQEYVRPLLVLTGEGKYFKAPPQRATRQWLKVELLYRYGVRFESSNWRTQEDWRTLASTVRSLSGSGSVEYVRKQLAEIRATRRPHGKTK